MASQDSTAPRSIINPANAVISRPTRTLFWSARSLCQPHLPLDTLEFANTHSHSSTQPHIATATRWRSPTTIKCTRYVVLSPCFFSIASLKKKKPPPQYPNQPQYPPPAAGGYYPQNQGYGGGDGQNTNAGYYGAGQLQPYFDQQHTQQQTYLDQQYPQQQQQYPPQQQMHYQPMPPPTRQNKSSGAGTGLLAGLCAGLACCCCLDCIF